MATCELNQLERLILLTALWSEKVRRDQVADIVSANLELVASNAGVDALLYGLITKLGGNPDAEMFGASNLTDN